MTTRLADKAQHVKQMALELLTGVLFHVGQWCGSGNSVPFKHGVATQHIVKTKRAQAGFPQQTGTNHTIVMAVASHL